MVILLKITDSRQQLQCIPVKSIASDIKHSDIVPAQSKRIEK